MSLHRETNKYGTGSGLNSLLIATGHCKYSENSQTVPIV